MRLKPAILAVLRRDDLKDIVDDLEIDGVDRRSVEAMRAALGRARRVKAEDLLWHMRKDQIKEVCDLVGMASKGDRQYRLGLDDEEPDILGRAIVAHPVESPER